MRLCSASPLADLSLPPGHGLPAGRGPGGPSVPVGRPAHPVLPARPRPPPRPGAVPHPYADRPPLWMASAGLFLCCRFVTRSDAVSVVLVLLYYFVGYPFCLCRLCRRPRPLPLFRFLYVTHPMTPFWNGSLLLAAGPSRSWGSPWTPPCSSPSRPHRSLAGWWGWAGWRSPPCWP